VPDDGGARFVAAAGGEGVVLAVDEDGVDVPGVGADGLQCDDLSVVVAVIRNANAACIRSRMRSRASLM